ncbi:MAG: F0F1 ATP synthase subunit gamma [Kiritimatiellae bacterium]|nr:F0F1 ATP synthase subunit gamma [Kiritimatiellia bacterium]
MTVTVRDLRRRIQAVERIRHVSSTLQHAATIRMARLREQLAAAEPYRTALESIAGACLARTGDGTHRLLAVRERGPECLLVFGAEKALCGSFNLYLIMKLENALRERDAGAVRLWVVGKAMRDRLRGRGHRVDRFFHQPQGDRRFDALRAIAAETIESFLNGRHARLNVLYSRSQSGLRQEPTLEPVLPVSLAPAQAGAEPAAGQTLYEPEAGRLLDRVLPELAHARLCAAFFNSAAAEQAARQASMGSAAENAGNMADELTLALNRVRQESITGEIRDIALGSTQTWQQVG